MALGSTDTVTVVNRTGEDFSCTVVEGVFWYQPRAVGINGKGVANMSGAVCIFPYGSLSGYFNGDYSFATGDYLIKGEVDSIESVRDVNKYLDVITIKSVNEHLKGSINIQHVTVG